MKYYCFVYPLVDHLGDPDGLQRLASNYAPFKNDQAAIAVASKMLEDDRACKYHGGYIIILRLKASGDRVYTRAIAEVVLDDTCPECGEECLACAGVVVNYKGDVAA